MFSTDNRNILLEIVKNTHFLDIPSLYQSNSVMREVCQSQQGLQIINEIKEKFGKELSQNLVKPKQFELFIQSLGRSDVIDDYNYMKIHFLFEYIDKYPDLARLIVMNLPLYFSQNTVNKFRYNLSSSVLPYSMETKLIAEVLLSSRTNEETIKFLEGAIGNKLSYILNPSYFSDYLQALLTFEKNYLESHPNLFSTFLLLLDDKVLFSSETDDEVIRFLKEGIKDRNSNVSMNNYLQNLLR